MLSEIDCGHIFEQGDGCFDKRRCHPPPAENDGRRTEQEISDHFLTSVLSQKKLYTFCHSGLDKPAPYLIRGNPVFSIWIPAGVYPVLRYGAGMTTLIIIVREC